MTRAERIRRQMFAEYGSKAGKASAASERHHKIAADEQRRGAINGNRASHRSRRREREQWPS